ncbi:MAG: alpha-L-fucosidase [Bacteroidota bacterium]|nr:alpha-L-fucosidase [Bacteroidota bacterium]
MKKVLIAILMLSGIAAVAQNNFQSPKPSKHQLAWHETEYYLFMHFGPNTFTGQEWGTGQEPENLFNPAELDCRQWCNTAKAAGAKGIIITAKHHDGFCLWPSNFSKHTVRESKWKDGKGDVLKELSQACREAGLKFGVYLSPWDRNHPDYGTEKYNTVFAGMMKEIFQNYGPIWEMWWDGANGEGPNGKTQDYDWKRFENIVKQYSPKTVVFSDIGPDIRWVGNENGIAGDPNWNFLDIEGFKRGLGAPPTDTLNQGNYRGKRWIPAECDVSIRPGWFWHGKEDDKIKTPQQLFTIYLKSVGRGANLLLNVPPDRRGLIGDKDVAALMGFKKLREESFENNLMMNAKMFYQFVPKDITFKSVDSNGVFGANLQDFIVEFPQKTKINCIVLKEAIQFGQTIRKFKVVLYKDNKTVREINGTSVGRKRILTFPEENITSFRVYLEDSKGSDNISSVKAYLIDDKLVEK